MPDNGTYARRGARFGLLAAFGAGAGQTFFIGLFGADLRLATGLDTAGFGAFYGAATLCSGLLMFWLGEVADRLALRRAVTLAVLCTVAGCLLISAVTTPAMLLAAFVLLRLGGQGLTAHLAVVTAARYGARRRGRSLAATSLGFIGAEALFPLLVTAALVFADWRPVWLGAAAVLLLGFLPLLRRLAAELPDDALAARGNDSPERPLGRFRLLRTPVFLATLAVVLTPAFVITAVFFHQSALAELRGWSTATVGGAFLVFALCRAAGTLATGRAVDRVGPLPLMRFHLWPLAGGLLALGFAPAAVAPWLSFAGLGLTMGAGSVVTGTVWAEVFGRRQLGLVRGVYASVMVIATAAAPYLGGLALKAPSGLAWITVPAALYAVLVPWAALPFLVRHYDSVSLPAEAAPARA